MSGTAFFVSFLVFCTKIIQYQLLIKKQLYQILFLFVSLCFFCVSWRFSVFPVLFPYNYMKVSKLSTKRREETPTPTS